MSLSLELPKKAGLFITATDTGVGKTVVSGAICANLVAQGLKVAPFKPFASGCRRDREGLVNSDTEFLAHCSQTDLPLSTINPITYTTPAAPILCEQLEHRSIDFEALSRAYYNICKDSDIVVVEGIGGIRVPLSDSIDLLDFASNLDLATIVVARPNLGTINHTLLTIDALRSRGIYVAGVIINGYNTDTADIVTENNAEIIATQGKVEILAIVPHSQKVNTEKLILPEEITEAISTINLQAIAGL